MSRAKFSSPGSTLPIKIIRGLGLSRDRPAAISPGKNLPRRRGRKKDFGGLNYLRTAEDDEGGVPGWILLPREVRISAYRLATLRDRRELTVKALKNENCSMNFSTKLLHGVNLITPRALTSARRIPGTPRILRDYPAFFHYHTRARVSGIFGFFTREWRRALDDVYPWRTYRANWIWIFDARAARGEI